MNLLWDIVLRAQDQGKEEADLFFSQAKEFSPFFEQSFPCLNEQRITSNRIELNLFFRLADLFQDMLSQKLKEKLAGEDEDYAEFREYLIDACLHTILYSDLRDGLTKREVFVRELTKELANGVFWMAAARDFRLIDPHKQMRLATLTLTQMQTGSSLSIYRRAILVLFPDARLYQLKADKKKLLLYLGQRRTEECQRMTGFVQDMFLPMSYHIRIFWEHHFGVIGVKATMKIGEIALY